MLPSYTHKQFADFLAAMPPDAELGSALDAEKNPLTVFLRSQCGNEQIWCAEHTVLYMDGPNAREEPSADWVLAFSYLMRHQGGSVTAADGLRILANVVRGQP